VALSLDKENMTWHLLGSAEAYKRSEQQVEVIEIIQEASEPLSASQIAKVAGKSKQNINQILKRLARDGQILRDPSTKKYSLPDLLNLPELTDLPGLPEDEQPGSQNSKPLQ
jgi:hypothetical protein